MPEVELGNLWQQFCFAQSSNATFDTFLLVFFMLLMMISDYHYFPMQLFDTYLLIFLGFFYVIDDDDGYQLNVLCTISQCNF